MLRVRTLCFLAASLTGVGCFTDSPTINVSEPTDSSSGPAGTTTQTSSGSGEDTTTAGTDPDGSSTATSASTADSGDTTSGTDGGSGTTETTDAETETGTTRAPVCPTFFDAFNDGVEDPAWRQSFPASTTEVDDELQIMVTGELNDEYVTMVVLPEEGGLEGGTMRLELGTAPVELGVRTTLWIQPDLHPGRIAYNLASRANGLRLEARITPEEGAPQVMATLDWSPDTMRWLQLREAQGTLYFEISADGTVFETFHEMPTPFDVSAAEVGFAGHNDLELADDVVVSVRTFEFICG